MTIPAGFAGAPSGVARAWIAHERELRRWLRARLREPADADDLMQALFIKALRQGQRFCDIHNARAWRFEVARNLLADTLRVARETVELPETLVAEDAEPDTVDALTACLPRLTQGFPWVLRGWLRPKRRYAVLCRGTALRPATSHPRHRMMNPMNLAQKLSLRRFFVGLLLGGLSLLAQAVEVAFERVADNVYAYIGDLEGRTYDNEGLNANLGLVVTPAGAVLIDSGPTYEVAKKIEAAARAVTPQPIRWVINTGGQDHRWLGNGYFKDKGAEILAHQDAQADMKTRAAEHMDGLRRVLKERLDGTVPTLPTRWLTEPDTRLELGGTVIELKHRGGGHTPGDTLVWLPQTRVLFGGDVVYVDRILGLHEVSRSKTWLASFEVIDQLKPAVIVPGHGRVTDLATAQRDTRDLLIALRAHMKKAVDDGVDMSAAVKSFDARPYRHLKHADVWLPQLANRTYLEVERE
ncbi:MBL fold metallo-hydrolase [Tepidimonas thermarum]|uniref:MBL fold metallo-hydrolase n=1 Tax=Tepidimonas thermarum TaxID=335431 RepID=UPI00163D939A|nr:MBL fold metallo-hydrolase [Tepidimonas thermarum]